MLLIGNKLITAKLRHRSERFIDIGVMHLIVIREELLDSGTTILAFDVRVCRVQTQCSKHRAECYVLSVLAPIDIHVIVHGELIDRIDAVLDDLLHDLLLPDVVDDTCSSIEAGKNKVFVTWVRLDDRDEVLHFLAKTAKFVEILDYLSRVSIIDFHLQNSLIVLLFLFALLLVLLIYELPHTQSNDGISSIG